MTGRASARRQRCCASPALVGRSRRHLKTIAKIIRVNAQAVPVSHVQKEFRMQKQIARSMLVALTCLLIGFGGRRDRDVDRALKKEYPDAQTEVHGSKLINGVKVYDVSIRTKHGESTAQVTEYG